MFTCYPEACFTSNLAAKRTSFCVILSALYKNAAAPFFCDVPKIFSGQSNFTQLSVSTIKEDNEYIFQCLFNYVFYRKYSSTLKCRVPLNYLAALENMDPVHIHEYRVT